MILRIETDFEFKSMLAALVAASGMTQQRISEITGLTPKTIRVSSDEGCSLKTAMAMIAGLDLGGDKALIASALRSTDGRGARNVRIKSIEIEVEVEGE